MYIYILYIYIYIYTYIYVYIYIFCIEHYSINVLPLIQLLLLYLFKI